MMALRKLVLGSVATYTVEGMKPFNPALNLKTAPPADGFTASLECLSGGMVVQGSFLDRFQKKEEATRLDNRQP